LVKIETAQARLQSLPLSPDPFGKSGRRAVAHSRSRGLSAGEIALARAAFGDGIDYERVRLNDGPGLHPFARIAFAIGNPAIAIGSTIYFGRDFCPDFSVPGRDRKGFVHEMAHVWQFRALGMPVFFLRYLVEFAKAKGRPGAMYAYEAGATPFGRAMLEAQAEMACDYGEARWSGNLARQAILARNLAGSGLYGL
jgi:hypothetical protein